MGRRSARRSIVAVIAMVLVGGALVQGASADFRRSISHIISHAKGVFYTKAQSNARYYTKAQSDVRYATPCIPWAGAVIASAFIEDSAVSTTGFSPSGVTSTGCEDVEAMRFSTGTFYLALGPSYSTPGCPSDVPIANVTRYGIGGQGAASYSQFVDTDDRTILRVNLIAADGSALTDGDFTVSVTGWIFGVCSGGARASARSAERAAG